MDPLNGESLEKLDMINTKKKFKDKEWKKSEEQIEKQNNGKAIITVFECKVKRDWIWTQRGLTPAGKMYPSD